MDFRIRWEENGNNKVWVNRIEYFLCKKHETLDELENRFDDLLDKLKRFEIKMSDAEKISKFADALPAEWNEFLNKLKMDSRFSNFYPKEFIRELKAHNYENNRKKKRFDKRIRKESR
ncbi:hypothetical protein Hanom_Chr00s000003g01603471 [Helianthus anomalus]